MKEITRLTELRGINTETRSAEFIISSEAVDRHGTVFKMDGWDLETYNRNPIVCYNHRHYGENPDTIIGTSEVFRDGDYLVGRVTFEDAEDNPLAEKVWRKVNKGILKMSSISARAHEYRFGSEANGEDKNTIYFTRQELLEWSVVSVGSNPQAFKRSIEEIEEIKKELEPKGMSATTKNRLNKLKVKKVAIK